MKKLLITGALGHIGSKIIHSISPGDFDTVVMVDNLSTQRYCALFALPEGVNFQFIDQNILEIDMCALINNVDVVIHLAAITDASSSFERRQEVEQVNHKGTEKVAEACAANGAKLIFPSTTSVYGSQSQVVDESCPNDDLKPQSPYAEYKLKSEHMLAEMGETHGLDFVTCRLGTIFGPSPGMRFHTAVNKFCWQATLGQPLTVWKTAMDQKRPYLGINDAVRAINFVINSQLFDRQTYNVISSNNTVSEVVTLIERIIDVKISLVDAEIMNQLSYHVLSDKLSALGFRPTDNLAAEIEKTLALLNMSTNR